MNYVESGKSIDITIQRKVGTSVGSEEQMLLEEEEAQLLSQKWKGWWKSNCGGAQTCRQKPK